MDVGSKFRSNVKFRELSQDWVSGQELRLVLGPGLGLFRDKDQGRVSGRSQIRFQDGAKLGWGTGIGAKGSRLGLSTRNRVRFWVLVPGLVSSFRMGLGSSFGMVVRVGASGLGLGRDRSRGTISGQGMGLSFDSRDGVT
ncbi:hypothetical protein TIFTF001_045299 [Ficus carica]|uniref:Uncharacterized protein n=1 Tax=Ficus carica TaxID=3494 RepID=A0AA88CKY3_FICCA|nr:hypothetical protein TIFTF001_045299 [Ficus carica]